MPIVAVPYRDIGCPHRKEAWRRVEQHLGQLPWPTITVDDDGPLFSRAGSLNLAFEHPDADVVIACDADILIPLEAITEAVTLAAESPGLVQPFDELHHLTAEGLIRYRWRFGPTTPLFGGCNVLSRFTWEQSGGWDAGYRGWGCEDISMARACAEVGPMRRITAVAVHLFHPKGGDYVSEETIAANGERMRR